MKDEKNLQEKNLQSEKLEDEELEKVSGGYGGHYMVERNPSEGLETGIKSVFGNDGTNLEHGGHWKIKIFLLREIFFDLKKIFL